MTPLAPSPCLSGKVAIITGSARPRGIGAAIASLLAQHGASVAVNYNTAPTAKSAAEVAARITSSAGEGKVVVVQADISTPAGAQKLVDETVAKFGRIDILVNNAAAGTFGPGLEASPESIQHTFAVNTFGPLYLVQAAVKHMPPRSRVINIGSPAPKLGWPDSPVYNASKAAMDALMFSLAYELGRNHGGITINTISPGAVDTGTCSAEKLVELTKSLVDMTKVEERLGTVEDIADAVLLLCDERSRWISGQVISVSGGIIGG
ncbi:gluconate 5-dehydrogenase [Aspergillus heterothallicus]